jgi:hypothetical protein
MYTAALEFLEDEREAFRLYEALATLSDEELERPMDAGGPAHGWRGRDLMGHIICWREVALEVARELAVGERSATWERVDREWREQGDTMNEPLLAAWAGLPMEDVRRRFGSVPGELRGTLTVVPEARWLKDPRMQQFFSGNLTEHDDEHRPELAAILAAAGQ